MTVLMFASCASFAGSPPWARWLSRRAVVGAATGHETCGLRSTTRRCQRETLAEDPNGFVSWLLGASALHHGIQWVPVLLPEHGSETFPRSPGLAAWQLQTDASLAAGGLQGNAGHSIFTPQMERLECLILY